MPVLDVQRVLGPLRQRGVKEGAAARFDDICTQGYGRGPMSDSDARRELVATCNDDILALLRDADAAGLPREQVVVFLLSRTDADGDAVAHALGELGQPLDDAEVCVAGFTLQGALELLGSVSEDLASRLHPEPPEGVAQLFCLASGGVLSLFLGITGETKEP